MADNEVALNGSGLPDAQAVLDEASPSALGELFARNPESLSDSELDAIIAELRVQRARWAKAEAEGTKGPGSRKAKAVATTKTNLSLSDLGL